MNLELVETAQAIAQAVVSIPIRDLMNLEPYDEIQRNPMPLAFQSLLGI